MNGFGILAVIILLGVLGRSTLVVYAALMLIVMKALRLDGYFPMLESTGISVGLFFLVLAVLVPFLTADESLSKLARDLASPVGVVSLIAGAFAAHLSGRGIALLTTRPEIVLGLVAGSIIGIMFLRGVPVGPLVAAGLASLLIELARL